MPCALGAALWAGAAVVGGSIWSLHERREALLDEGLAEARLRAMEMILWTSLGVFLLVGGAFLASGLAAYFDDGQAS